MYIKGSRIFSLAILLVPLSCGVGYAQDTGAIVGVVKEATGAVMPRAAVKITNTGTGITRDITTDDNGRYVAESLPIGVYDITAEMTGFKRFTHKGIKLNVADRLSIDIVMEVGQVSELVTIISETPVVQTETGALNYLISGNQVTELAVNGRNFVQLAQLVPGASSVSRSDQIGVGVTGNKGVTFNGLGQGYSGWLVDGAQNTDVGNQNSLSTYPAMEAIGEFRILSSNYSAEYGTTGGANVVAVTRSGSKDFHGSAYEFVRNDVFDARNFFAASRAPLRYNNFGYTLGGPLFIPGKYNTAKDKDFFFWSQEWRRIRRGTTVQAQTPTEAMRRGDFSELLNLNNPFTSSAVQIIDPTTKLPFTGNIIPTGRINTSASALLNQVIPLPNRGGQALNYVASPSVPTNFRQELIRGDHYFNERINVMVRYIQDTFDDTPVTTLWTGSAFPTVNATIASPGKNLITKLTHAISPKTLNEFNFNVAANKIAIVLNGPATRPSGLSVAELFPENRENRIPNIDFSQGWGDISTGSWPWKNKNQVYTWSDTLGYVAGAHSLKMGGHYQWQIKDQDAFGPTQGNFTFNGSFTGNAIADFLLGLPNSYSELDIQRTGRYRYHQIEAFFQDDWKVSPRLTVNWGVRWFAIPHIFERDNAVTTFVPERWSASRAPIVNPDGTIVPGSGDILGNGIVQAGNGIPKGMVKNYWNAFAPRFGFAWNPWGDGKTVIRGGYGIGYYRVEGNDIYDFVNNPPFAKTANITNPPLNNPGGGAAAPPTPVSLFSYDFQYKVPTAQTYSLGIQHELFKDTGLEIAYVGSRGTHLDHARNINQPLRFGGFDFNPLLNGNTISVDSLRPYRGWSTIRQSENTGSSTYHSLQVNFDKRFAAGFKFQLAYTFSRAVGDVFDSNGRSVNALPQDSYNMKAERGLLGFDRPHNLSINYIYELPFFKGRHGAVGRILGGWEISGITTVSSGPASSPGIDTGSNGLATRPNLVGNQIEGPRTVEKWFNTAAFAAPAPGFFGNAGRNIIREPGTHKWDMSFFKNNRISESVNLQFRAEFFNIFNHASFNGINTTFGSGAFGSVTSARDPRIIQFGLKLGF
jgi:Carboxypeptidase regulatory-like domain